MSATLKAMVVDDEPLARDELMFLLKQCGGVDVVGQAGDANEALSLAEKKEPDVAFVDLRMPGPDGIALAEALRVSCPKLHVVIVSAHDDALRAFEAKVLDYLLKPVRLERLQTAVERVREAGGGSKAPPEASEELTRLAVRRAGVYVVLEVSDVIYFEVKDELVWAVTASDRFALDLTMTKLEKRLPGAEFFRSHRGALVRVDKIRAMEPAGAGTYELVLDHPSDPRVPLARERARLLKERIPFAG